jgi:hypothetical protein
MVMKKMLLVLTVIGMCMGAAWAKEKTEAQGTLVSENSVQCGSQQAKGKKTSDLMCQEYVIRTGTTEYHVRQEKEGHKELLPVNAPVELSISKDRMKFKVNGKGYEMLIVSEAAVTAPAATTPAPAAATPKQ